LKRNGRNAPQKAVASGPVASVAIPAIDRDAPDQLETATFAMG
jgi:hypothetical protein